MFQQHLESGADITVVCSPEHCSSPRSCDYLTLDPDGRVNDLASHPTVVNQELESLEIYVMSKQLLLDMVEYCSAHNIYNFSRGVLQPRIDTLNIRPYVHPGHIARFSSVNDYFDQSVKLIDPKVQADLFNPARPIRTKDQSTPATYYGPNGVSLHSMVADGCYIEGKVENSVLGRGVVVEAGATVSNSVLMQGTVVRAGASLSYVIADKDVQINQDRSLMGHITYPLAIAKGSIV